MRRLFTFMIAIGSMAGAAQAADISVALTEDNIEVDAGFAGARVTLFGVITGLTEEDARGADIIAVVRGPDLDYQIRRMQKKNLIWTPGPAILVKAAPGLYLTSSTRPLDEIAPREDRERLGLGAAFAPVSPEFKPGNAKAAAVLAQYGAAALRAVFVDAAYARGVFRDDASAVEFKKGALFTITLDLPADTPVGSYALAVYLYRGGALIDQDDARLSVNKVGFERRIYELAHNQPIAYDIVCVVMALVSGWAAAAAFRK